MIEALNMKVFRNFTDAPGFFRCSLAGFWHYWGDSRSAVIKKRSMAGVEGCFLERKPQRLYQE